MTGVIRRRNSGRCAETPAETAEYARFRQRLVSCTTTGA
jgi:hypothetical protein